MSESIYELFQAHIRAETPVALATIIEGPGTGAKLLVVRRGINNDVTGSLGHPELDRVVARDTAGELEAGRTGVRHYGPEGQATPEDLIDTPTVSVFIESFSPAPQMWIFGAVDFTAALARVAKVTHGAHLNQESLTIQRLCEPSLGHDQIISNQVGDRTKSCQDYGLRRGGPHGLLNSLGKHKASRNPVYL